MTFLQKAIRSSAFKPTIAVVLAILAMLALPDQFVNPAYEQYERCRARVLAVNNDNLRFAGIVVYGEQYCQVELLSGKNKGTVCNAMNMMTGSLSMDKEFRVGDVALVMVGASAEQSTYKVTMVDHYRLNIQAALIVAFVLVLIALAGWIGVRAILSFAFTILCIWKVLIPLLLRNVSPILCGLFITLLLTVVIIVLVYGLDRRFLSAASGSLLGTGLTALLAIAFVRLLNIHGAVMSNSESLLYAGYSLSLTETFIASVFIASSGALTDIAVDITSAVNEVYNANPDTSKTAAIRAGMNVGRAALGTMTTTLLLAYSGSYISMLMVFVAQGTPLVNILNLNYISAEVLNIVIGSFGLITVAPFTAVTSGILLYRRKDTYDSSKAQAVG